MISQYGKPDPYGVKNLMYVVAKRIRFEGFIQFDSREKYWKVYPPNPPLHIPERAFPKSSVVTRHREYAADG